MIQRIQSIYLLLAGLFSAFTLFVPLITPCKDEMQATEHLSPWLYNVIAFVIIILALVTIFNFKKRKRQIQFINYTLACCVLWYIAFAACTYFSALYDEGYNLHIGLLFPLLSVITLFLAKKAIKHDEDLVRAVDRIR